MTNKRIKRRQFLKLSSGLALSGALPFVLPGCANRPSGSLARLWPGYADAVVIDGLSSAFEFSASEIGHSTLDQYRASGLTAINATIPYPGDDYATANVKIDHARSMVRRYSQYLRLVKTPQDIVAAKQDQQIGLIIGFQSTEMFGDDLDRIQHFAGRGARYMQMTYNRRSQFGDGCLEKDNQGLTPLGIEALATMEAHNVLVDLSHSGQRTTAEAIKHATRPLTISHTGCNSLYVHPRSNDDAELKAVADKGGVVGIYLMPFLEGGEEEIKAEMVMRHIEHAINVCGEDHVAIGSDQGVIPVDDGPEYRERIRKDVERRIAAGISAPGETPNRPPFIPQLNAVNRMELVASHLKGRGHSRRVIEKVLGQNLLSLYREVWT